MRASCKRFLGLMVAILAMVAPSPLLAEDSDLMNAARKLMEAAGDGKVAEILKTTRILKDAGLSYQGDLVAPQAGVLDCKDRKDQFQVLFGIYLFDCNYAILFGKKEIGAGTLQFARDEVFQRMTVRPKVGAFFAKPALSRRFMEGDPADESNWNALFTDVQANYERIIRDAEKDPDLLDFMVDRLFGEVLECMYVSCKLSLGAPGGEKLIPVFNAASSRIDLILPLLDSLKDPELETLFKRSERLVFLNAVKEIIRKKGGNLDAADLRNILILVEPVRKSYTAKCRDF